MIYYSYRENQTILKEYEMKKLLKTLLIVGSIGIGLIFTGCESIEDASYCSIVGTWQSGSSDLWFYSEDDGREYIQFINDQVFDRGTYSMSSYSACDGYITMSSNGGQTSGGDYTIFDNNTKLNGFTDGYGNLVTYNRYTP